jgi:hypothetical protein
MPVTQSIWEAEIGRLWFKLSPGHKKEKLLKFYLKEQAGHGGSHP